ncbi:Fibronectin type III domain-containing protein [Cohnella sp. OV330]|uniref:DUF4962 domain-containing protein n=1 Tax=Cohnella sp. OV330 TaxID=1855288 RepID=UPI0008ECBD2C|nr:DUF4962 domain-containing protein [Cohnella sp. OV330]SFB39315.1 Fibronectin type III domain-containing protein [Cohnella sp. OV330]
MRVSAKRWTALGLVLFMIGGVLPHSLLGPARASAAAPAWPQFTDSAHMPFRPIDSLVTSQSPPDFSWPLVQNADSYQLQVSRTSDFATVAHEAAALTTNYYNFPVSFDAGTWYWRVRYDQDGTASEWTAPRKFRIEEDAVPFPVPPVDTLVNSVPDAHPRIWVTADTLDDFRALSTGQGKTIYERRRSQALANLDFVPVEPTTVTAVDKRYVDESLTKMMNAAFTYLISGDTRFGDSAKRQLLAIASWNTDPNGTTGYVTDDQIHRAIVNKAAIAYDWIYDRLAPADIQNVQTMVTVRTNTLIADLFNVHSMFKNPYDSHGWTSFGLLTVIATAMLHDVDQAESWFRMLAPAYINLLPPWGGEDGGWSMGTGYWQGANLSNKETMDVLLYATGFNLYDKAFARNEGHFPLYTFPHGSPHGLIGDGNTEAPTFYNVSFFRRAAQMYQDPHLQWGAQAVGATPIDQLYTYFHGDPDLPAEPPVELPKSRWFKDIGVVAMHSDLVNPDRVSMYFKSSPYGSYVHSHADQNSFVINAYGEPLAIKAGYYESFGFNRPHHGEYTRQTLSSNAITFDGRQGQPINKLDANGTVTGYVDSADFAATSGDATAAYMGGVGKAVRHMLYIRPNSFVVIDRLKSANPAGSEFEWGLHAEHDLKLDADQAGATIVEGRAALKTRIHYPSNIRATVDNRYLNQAGVEVRPVDVNIPNQMHAAFITPKSQETTIVSTMGVYPSGGEAPEVVSENHGSYMELTFEDGTVVYVRMTNGGEVDAGSIRFDGEAAAVKGDSVMLVSGTKLVKDGVTLLSSDKPATIAFGDRQLSISGTEEINVAVQTPGVVRVRDMSGEDIANSGTPDASVALRGVYWQATADKLTVRAEKGAHAFKLNDAPSSQPLENVELQVSINGVPQTVSLQARSDIEGESVAWGKLTNEEGLYQVVEAPTGFAFERHGGQNAPYLEPGAAILLRGEADRPLTLLKAGSGSPAETVVRDDYDAVRDTLSVFAEAESFQNSSGGTFNRYTNRPFLSGGVGVSNWTNKGQWLDWTLNVPKQGRYDLVLKYVAGWDAPEGALTSRLAKLGDNAYYFEAPKTVDFGTLPEYWKSIRVKTGALLPAGPLKLTMWNSVASMNLDWIGLVEAKDDEIRPSAPGAPQLVAKTNTSATVRWGGSTDNVGVKEYRIYSNGQLAKTVPAGSTEVQLTGLTAGKSYKIMVRAVDTSDNESHDSPALDVVTTDTLAPVWAEGAVLSAANVFPDKATLSWSGSATDNSGQPVAYDLYRIDGAAATKLASVTGTTYEVQGLQPSGSYSFKLEAVDTAGNATKDGPSVTVRTPGANMNGNGFYEPFTGMAAGTSPAGNGWTVDPGHGTSIAVTAAGDGNKVLTLTDSYYDLQNEYGRAPGISKAIPAVSGKVVFETKFKSKALGRSDSGNYELQVVSGNADAVRISGGSTGTVSYRIPENGTTKAVAFPSKNGDFKIPLDQWIKVRFEMDTSTKTYDLIYQADALKSYAGPVDAPGTLDKTNGIYRINGLPFNTPTLSSVNAVAFAGTRYTGEYTFDDMALYKATTPPAFTLDSPQYAGQDELVPVAIGVGSVTNAVYENVSLRYDQALFDYVGVEAAGPGITLTGVLNDPAQGTVSFAVDNGGPIGGSGPLALLQLRTKAGASGFGSVRIEAAASKDQAGVTLGAVSLPGKTIGVHVITELEPAIVATPVGSAPALPEAVTAVYAEQTTGPATVTWASVDPSQYAVPGTFTVTGTVAGTSIPAQAVVTVVNDSAALLTGPGTARIGEPFVARLSVVSVHNVSAQEVVVSYDKTRFEYVDAAPVQEQTVVQSAVDNTEAGTVKLILANPGAENAVSGDVPLLDLTFKAKEGAAGGGTIAVTRLKLSDGDGRVLDADLSGASLAVTIADHAELAAAIADAQTAYDQSAAGMAIGQYPAAARSALLAAIEAARAVLADAQTTEAQADVATAALLTALQKFAQYVIAADTGDLNGSGGIDIGDVGIVAGHYGQQAGDAGWSSAHDLDGDGAIGLYELAFVSQKLLEQG